MRSIEPKDIVRRFRAMYVTQYPVRLRVCASANDDWGETSLTKIRGVETLVVKVSKDLSEVSKALITVHELSHCLDWRDEHVEEARSNDHGSGFGLAYAKVWKLL